MSAAPDQCWLDLPLACALVSAASAVCLSLPVQPQLNRVAVESELERWRLAAETVPREGFHSVAAMRVHDGGAGSAVATGGDGSTAVFTTRACPTTLMGPGLTMVAPGPCSSTESE